MKKAYWIVFLLLAISFLNVKPVHGQIEKGKKLFAQEQYADAIKALKKDFYGKSRNIDAGLLLAKCYYYLQQYDEASDVMSQIGKVEISKPDDIRFTADLEIVNENFSEAFLTLLQLLEKDEHDEETLKWFFKISDIVKWDSIPNGSDIKLMKGINSIYNDHSPYISKNKELWFVSDVLGIQMVFPAAYDNRNLSLLYKTKTQKQDPTSVQKPTMLIKSRDYYYHDLAIVEWEAQDKYILTLRHLNDASETVGLYISNKSGKEKEFIPFKHNGKYNTGYATFDKSGTRMIFSSDRPGGYGKMDLWYSDWIDGDWTEPVNMGPVINSPANEMYPSYITGRLYFSSNRADMGYGALDIYYSSEALGYKKIKNLKSPINGPYDDFAITFINEKEGYFTSNRKSGEGGDDILAFIHSPVQLTIPENHFEITNEIVSRDAVFNIYTSSDSLVATIKNVHNNAFQLPNLKTNQTYKLVPSSPFAEKANLRLIAQNQPKKFDFKQDVDGAYYFEVLSREDWDDVEFDENDFLLQSDRYPYKATIISAQVPKRTPFVLSAHNGEKIDTLFCVDGNKLFLPPLEKGKLYELEMMASQFEEEKVIEIFNSLGERVYTGISEGKKKYVFSFLDQLDQDMAKLDNDDDSRLKYDFDSKNETEKSGKATYFSSNEDIKYHDINPNQEYFIENDGKNPHNTIAFNIAENTRVNIYDAKNQQVANINAKSPTALILPTLPTNTSYRVVSESVENSSAQNYTAIIENVKLAKQTSFLLSELNSKHADTMLVENNNNLILKNLQLNKAYRLEFLNEIFPDNKNILIYNSKGTLVFSGESTNKKYFDFTVLDSFDSGLTRLDNDDDSYLNFDLSSGLKPKSNNTSTASQDHSRGIDILNILPGERYKIHTNHKRPEDVLAVNIPAHTELTILDKENNVVATIHSSNNHSFILPYLKSNEEYTFISSPSVDSNMEDVVTPTNDLEETALTQNAASKEGNKTASANYLKRIDYDSKEATNDYGAKILNADVATKTAFVLSYAKGAPIDTIYSDDGSTLRLEGLKKNTPYELEMLQSIFPHNHEIVILDQYGEQVYRGLSRELKTFEFTLFDISDQTISKMDNKDESILKLSFEGRIESRSAKPISISIHDGTGKFLSETKSSMKGDFVLKDISKASEYIFNTDSKNMDDYIVLKLPNQRDSIYLKRRKEGDFYMNYDVIQKHGIPSFENDEAISEKTGFKFSIPNIYYAFDSYELNAESKKSIDKLIELLKKNPDLRIELQSHTDRRGREDYNLWLSQQRANMAVRYMVRAGISSSRLVAVGKGVSEPIQDCPPGMPCTEKDHAKNRRTEFMILAPVEFVSQEAELNSEDITENELAKNSNRFLLPNIYYNFDSYTLRPESRKSLDSLVAILEINPELRIEIQSHTDIRGSASYNVLLSQRRANAVVEYLAEAGIDKSRLFAVGKGDKELLNGCTTPASCTDKKHAVNRRTEFIILSTTAQL